MKNLCKRAFVRAGMAVSAALLAAGPACADIWTSGTTAVTEATTNVTSLLIVAVGVPIAFFGYGVLKKVFNSAK